MLYWNKILCMVIFFCGVLIIIKMYKSTYTFAIPGQGSLLKEKVEADRDSLLKDASTLQSEEQNNLNSKPQWVPEDYCHPVSEHFQTTESFLSCNWAETDLPKCKYRMKASLQCSGDASPRVVLRIVPSDTPPDRLAFNDSCLLSVVRSSLCKEKGMRVPRVSIYTHLGKNNLPFYWFLSVLSVVRSFRPCVVLFVGDYLPQGNLWDTLLYMVPNIFHVQREQPTSIFGNPVKALQHRSDVLRLESLIAYGGLYLDGDSLLLRSIDDLRTFPAALGQETKRPNRFCAAVIVSEPNNFFINLWYRNYKTFDGVWWSYHSGVLPYRLAKNYTEDVRVMHTFFGPTFHSMKSLYEGHFNWSESHSLHLYHRHFGKYLRGEIHKTNSSFGEIARFIMYGSKTKCISPDFQ